MYDLEEGAASAHAAVLEEGRGARRRLDPAYVSAARLAGWIFAGVVGVLSLVGAGVVWLVVDLETWARVGITLLILAQLVGVALLAHAWPAIEYRHTSYRIGSEGLEIRRGVVWRHVVFVPRTRIQHTDVAQGPVQRRFGLGSLVVHTAGTHEYEVTLGGVAHEDALAIRDALLEGLDAEEPGGSGDER